MFSKDTETENKKIVRKEVDLVFIRKAAKRFNLLNSLHEYDNSLEVEGLLRGIIGERISPRQASLEDEIQILRSEINDRGLKEQQDIFPCLKYFGLPGGKAYDIKDWKEYISYVYAVERDYSLRCELQSSLIRIGYTAADITIHEEEIEDLILENNKNPVIEATNLVNFDWYGQLLTPGERSRRLAALQEFIKIQHDLKVPSFLMFVTILAGRSPTSELEDFLNSASSYVVKDRKNNSQKIFDWLFQYAKPHEYLFVATPIMIILYGGLEAYDTSCLYIMKYKGKEEIPMIHFVFWFRHTGRRMPFLESSRFKPIPLKSIKTIDNGIIENYDWDIPDFVED